MHMIKVEKLQCNLRSLENVNNGRKIPQVDYRLGGNVNICSLIFQESGHVHSYKDNRNELLYNTLFSREENFAKSEF